MIYDMPCQFFYDVQTVSMTGIHFVSEEPSKTMEEPTTTRWRYLGMHRTSLSVIRSTQSVRQRPLSS